MLPSEDQPQSNSSSKLTSTDTNQPMAMFKVENTRRKREVLPEFSLTDVVKLAFTLTNVCSVNVIQPFSSGTSGSHYLP